MRSIWLIAKSVLIEALRRREIYVIVLLTLALILCIFSINFFNLTSVEKFYREMTLRLMSIATALTVIVLSARQLPREFQNRTIYPILAKPITRTHFVVGKLFGVFLATLFCFGLFMVAYVGGALYLGQSIPWGLFLQFIYLQMLMMLILATLSFWLSMIINIDAAITIGVIAYAFSATMSAAISTIYDFSTPPVQLILKLLVYATPQLNLFDLSAKTVHAGELWGPLEFPVMAQVSVYGLFWILLFYGFAWTCFRRRAL